MERRKFSNGALFVLILLGLSGCQDSRLFIRGVTPAKSASCSNASPFDGGDGSAGNPFVVCSKAQLNNVRNFLTQNFIQTADIDVTEADCLSFAPIGSVTPFTGSYDGQNYSIKNFCYQNVAPGFPVGLFSQANGTIKNLSLTNVNIIGDNKTGGLIGLSAGVANIENVAVTGTVVGSNMVGGLIGESDYTTILKSSSGVTVTGSSLVGNLVGYAYVTTVQSSYTAGNTSGNMFTGGLCGELNESIVLSSHSTGNVVGLGGPQMGGLVGKALRSYIFNSYSSSNVTADSDAGGLLGVLDRSTVHYCYSSGAVVSLGSDSAGLIAHIQNVNNSVFDSFTTSSVNGQMNVGGVIGYMNAGAVADISHVFTTITSITTADPPSTHAIVGQDDSTPGDVFYDFASNLYNSLLVYGDPASNATPIPTASFTDISYFNLTAGYDITTVWKPTITGSHPELQWMP